MADLTIAQLIAALKTAEARIGGDASVIITWEGTVHGLEPRDVTIEPRDGADGGALAVILYADWHYDPSPEERVIPAEASS